MWNKFFSPEGVVATILLVSIGAGLMVLAFEGVREEPSLENATPYIEIVAPSGFVNTEGITLGELVGNKVILVDFMTYSCINCQRTFPYLNDWYEKYKDQGLEIVGIHTPEFAFERDRENVRAAAAEFGLQFPIVLDNEYATWNAYKNRYWPRKYLIDIHGNIIYDHIGEGAYEETERVIQEALTERSALMGERVDFSNESAEVLLDTLERGEVRSPEVYFGSARNELLANGVPGARGSFSFKLPSDAPLNALLLGGAWRMTPEYAENEGPASIVFSYAAKNVFFVAGSEQGVEVAVYRDDVLIRTFVVEAERLYTLIEGEAYGEHTLRIEVNGPGLRAFTFTFG